MHQVLQHIRARRNKSVPINDRRNIALIMFGGTMCGVRGAGAGIALEEMGLDHAFDSIWTVSSGFPNASFMLSGQPRLGTSIYYDDLPRRKFISFFRPWKLVDIGTLVEVVQTTKYFDAEALLKVNTKLFVGLQNLDKKKLEFLEVHDYEAKDYPKLLNAVTSIPYLHPGSVKIGKYRYEDLPWDQRTYKNLIQEAISRSNATDILMIFNYHSQVKFENPDPKKIYIITPPENWRLGRLELNCEILKKECLKMGALTKRIFGDEGDIKLEYDSHEIRN